MCLDIENVNKYNTSKVSGLKCIDSPEECSDQSIRIHQRAQK